MTTTNETDRLPGFDRRPFEALDMLLKPEPVADVMVVARDGTPRFRRTTTGWFIGQGHGRPSPVTRITERRVYFLEAHWNQNDGVRFQWSNPDVKRVADEPLFNESFIDRDNVGGHWWGTGYVFADDPQKIAAWGEGDHERRQAMRGARLAAEQAFAEEHAAEFEAAHEAIAAAKAKLAELKDAQHAAAAGGEQDARAAFLAAFDEFGVVCDDLDVEGTLHGTRYGEPIA